MRNGVLYRSFSFSCVIVALFLLCSSVSAVGSDGEITQEMLDASYASTLGEEYVPVEEDTPSDQGDNQVVYTEENPLYVQVKTEASLDNTAMAEPAAIDDPGISLLADAPITSDDTSGLKAILLEILGPYEPILFTYQYGNASVGREVFQDDVWLCSFWMLAIMVYSIFRLLGGWLSRKQ